VVVVVVVVVVLKAVSKAVSKDMMCPVYKANLVSE
jgi:hypothetical protein